MKKKTVRKAAPKKTAVAEMQAEYDFRNGVRGKYAAQVAKESNVVILDPDVAEVFTDGESVNRALRMLLEILPTPRRRQTRKRSS